MLARVVRACKSRREGGGRSTRGERAAKAARGRQVFDNVQHVFVQISSNELVDFIKLFYLKKNKKKKKVSQSVHKGFLFLGKQRSKD